MRGATYWHFSKSMLGIIVREFRDLVRIYMEGVGGGDVIGWAVPSVDSYELKMK
jgi:hypothetical protein